MTWKSLLTGGGLLLNESSVESSCMSFLHYFHTAVSNNLFEKPDIIYPFLSGRLTQVGLYEEMLVVKYAARILIISTLKICCNLSKKLRKQIHFEYYLYIQRCRIISNSEYTDQTSPTETFQCICTACQTCVKRPYKSRHVFGFLGRWLLIAV